MGNGIDEPLGRVAGGATHAYVADHLMSVRGLVDSAGALANQYTYEAFGTARSQVETVTNRLRFTARELDPLVGWQYTRNRYLALALGRFTQRDPLRDKRGRNLYAYVLNAPLTRTDPFGLEPNKPFPDIDAAGIDAIRYYNQDSIDDNVEIGGWIYEMGGQYYYTTGTDTEGEADLDPKQFEKPPSGGKYAGDYHTHGRKIKGYDGERFSDKDKKGNDDNSKIFCRPFPGYLGTPSGRILRYTPNGVPLGGTVDPLGVITK